MEYRVVVVGSGGVGKSALTVRFIQGNFVQKYDPTIEDSYRKQVDVDGKAVLLDILDTAGQEEYSALRDAYMKTGEGFIVVFAVDSENSFDAVSDLRNQIVHTKESDDTPIMIAANKVDVEDREISADKGKSLAEEFGCGYIETSAKTDTNVKELFESLVRLINAHKEKNPGGDGDKSKKGGCVLL